MYDNFATGADIPLEEEPNDMATATLMLAYQSFLKDMEDIKDLEHNSKKRFRSALASVGAEVSGDISRRDKLVRMLYWEALEAQDGWIKDAFQLNMLPRVIAGKGWMLTGCSNCGNPMDVVICSRSEVKSRRSLWTRDPPKCKACGAKEQAIRDEKDRMRRQSTEARRNGWQERQRTLRDMPYREYLDTPEWKEIRNRKLKRAHYHCELCNAGGFGVQLNVHHKRYGSRGDEDDRDLILLCQQCHGRHHDKVQESG